MIPAIMLIASLAQQKAANRQQQENELINTLRTPQNQNNAEQLLGSNLGVNSFSQMPELKPLVDEEEKRKQMFGL